ncbi:MAG: hypothetical protein ACI4VC_00890 [Clostridia bacterium]
MRFTRYKICKVKVGSNNIEKMDDMDEEITFKSLNLSKKLKDTIGEFAIPLCKHEETIIVGNLSQTYGISLMKFSGNSKEEIPIEEDKANDNKTYFFINCKEKCIYIQNRRYTPKELNPNLAVERIEKLLNKYLIHDILETIVLQKENINYEMDVLQNFFRTSFVRTVEFNNVSNLKLEPGTKLHNPRKDLDEAAIESWNTYSSENVESIKIKAKKDKSIAKNPIANIGFKLAEQNANEYEKIIKNVEIEQDGQKEQLKPKGNEYLIIPISDKDKTIDEFLNRILLFLRKRRT